MTTDENHNSSVHICQYGATRAVRHWLAPAGAVVLLALLAVVRKIIIDMSSTDALHLMSLAAAILALGAAYWLVRDSDHRSTAPPADRP